MYRRVLLAILAVAAVWFVGTHSSEVASVARTGRTGNVPLLALALLLQVVYYAGYVGTFHAAFRATGFRRSFLGLVPVVFASIFVSTVTPTGGTGGIALIVDDSVRRDIPGSRATAAVLLAEFADFAGFAVIMFFGVGYLASAGRLTTTEGLAAALLTLLILGIAGVLAVGLARPHTLVRLLGVAERALSRALRLFRRESPQDWSARLAAEFSAAAATIAGRPARVVRAWLISLVGHAFDLLSFGVIGFAFGWRNPGSLLAAYAIGVLLWIVSIVPQGVGIVEGAIAVVLVSFGAPAGTAAAISLIYRGISFWIPFAIGALCLRWVSSFASQRAAPPSARESSFTVHAAALFALVLGTLDIIGALTPEEPYQIARLERYVPVRQAAPHLAAALSGVALILLARALWHRKRVAWLVTCGVLAVSLLTSLLHGSGAAEIIAPTAMLVWLLLSGQAFSARSDVPSIAQGLRVLIGAFAVTIVYGTLGFYLLDQHFGVVFGFGQALRQTIIMFIEFGNPGLEPVTGFGRYFADSIYIIAAVTFMYAQFMLLRPVLIRRGPSTAEIHRAEEIVTAYGCNSLARLALLPDKLLFFSDEGSLLSYVVVGGVAVVLGDPIGPRESAVTAVREFEGLCRHNAWKPLLYETTPSFTEDYRRAGLVVTRIGHEAVVDLKSFSLEGKSKKSLRNTIHHFEAQGYVADLIPPPQSNAMLRRLRDVSDSWLSFIGGSEKSFSLGWFDDDYIRGGPVMVVRSSSGRIEAFANIVSEYQANELTIDLMRHGSEAPPGTMDFLFVRLFEYADRQGYETFNLGLASLSGIGESSEDPLAEKALRFVFEHGKAFYSFQGLYEYKDKFDPRWEPRFIAYPTDLGLPSALLAGLRANAAGNPLDDWIRGVQERIGRRLRPGSSARPVAPASSRDS